MSLAHSKTLAKCLFLRNAVCKCDPYLSGYTKTVLPHHTNCLPPHWRLMVSTKPFIHTRKKQTLQYRSPAFDHITRVLEVATGDQPQTVRAEFGPNYRPSPCTDYGAQVLALETRQRIQETRPWVIEERHLRGVQHAMDRLYAQLNNIIKHQKTKRGEAINKKPTYHEKAQKYSGSKRVHYEQCAREIEANGLDRRSIFHECAGKWGELSDRPRVLLVQSIRAKGAPGVKPGALLRAPILAEGIYRDYYEDALHKWKHARGFKNVASGSSLRTRGQAITSMIEPGDQVLSLDWSSFDGSLGQLGVIERNTFLAHTRRIWGNDPILDSVIHTQNFCTVQGGPVRAQLYGNRGSGTAGTSTGNKCVVLACIAYCLGPAFGGARGVKLYCDGDDTLIIVPPQWQGENNRWIRSWCRRFTALGLETKVQQNLLGSREEMTAQVRFCRAGVIHTSSGPLLCKEPLDAFCVFTNFRKHFRGPRFKDYLTTLSVGIRGTYSEVPILSAFADFFDVGGTYDAHLMDSSGIEHMMLCRGGGATGTVTDEARWSFYRTFGVPPTTQVECEQLIRHDARLLKQQFT